MGESRTELLAWINDLLQTDFTKIESLGTGAAFCQIMDSIYGDTTLNRVKFNAKMEYEYVNNFKTLQACFDKHKVDKVVPVTKLVKCRMQDNLEFTQWLKRYWDSYYPGGVYDAHGRLHGAGISGGGVSGGGGGGGGGGGMGRTQARAPTGMTSRGPATRRAPSAGSSGKPVHPGAKNGRMSSASGRAASPMDAHTSSAMVQDLTRQMAEMRVTVDGLEKERDFYFQKLREIEVLVQRMSEDPNIGSPENAQVAEVLAQIQQILYSTEEGFDAPEEGAGGGNAAAYHPQEEYDDDVY